MILTVLGKYGPYPKVNGATSSYLLSTKGYNVLLDMGAGSFSRLKKQINPEEIDVIIFSHFHFDHSSDVGVLIYYYQSLFNNGYTKKPLVFCPNFGGAIADAVINCPYFNVQTVKGGDTVTFKDLTFRFFDMNHPVPCVGVKITNGEKVFSYTGDTNLSESLNNLYDDADLVLADGAFLLDDWNETRPHLSVSHVVDLTKKWGNKSIISHINPNYDEKTIEKEMEKAEGQCVIAQEMTTYRI